MQPLADVALRREGRGADVNAAARLRRVRRVAGLLCAFGRRSRAVRLLLHGEIGADRARNGLGQRQRLREQAVFEREARDDVVHLAGLETVRIVRLARGFQRRLVLRDAVVEGRARVELRLIFLLLLPGGLIFASQRFLLGERRADEMHAEHGEDRETGRQSEQLFVPFGHSEVHSAVSFPCRMQFRLSTYMPSS